jgi:carotenoid cleavage dioxygenase-like enzyme
MNMATGAVSERYLDDEASEFPRIAPAVQGHQARYGYTLGMADASAGGGMGGRVNKYDLANGASREVHQFPAGHEPGETVFVPADNARNEDDGYLMTYVYKPETDTSYMVILDATDVAADPIAEIHIPRRVVAGFHSSWIPDAG